MVLVLELDNYFEKFINVYVVVLNLFELCAIYVDLFICGL